MGVHTNIRNALLNHLQDLPGAPDIVEPNKSKTPVLGIPYLRATILPVDGVYSTLQGGIAYTGIFQVDIFVPKDKGTDILENWMDAITAHFSGNLTLESGGSKVYISAPQPGELLQEPAWSRSYISINYECNI